MGPASLSQHVALSNWFRTFGEELLFAFKYERVACYYGWSNSDMNTKLLC